MIRMLLHMKKKVLFVLPFVSVVAEKVQYFKSTGHQLFSEPFCGTFFSEYFLRIFVEVFDVIEGVVIDGYYGGHVPKKDNHGDAEAQPDVAVCTIEKVLISPQKKNRESTEN